MELTLERFLTGPLDTNTYLLISKDTALVVDPSSGCEEVLQACLDHSLKVAGIIITHGHYDHIAGIPEVIERFGELPVYINPGEYEMLTNPMQNLSMMIGQEFSYEGPLSPLDEGPFSIAGITGEVFCVPGHSAAGCALLCDHYLLCGDILFAGSVGRSDLPGGNPDLLIEGITKKLMPLPDETVVCPGHGGRSTIGRERQLNPYLSGKM
ncbi:MAG: MBL fold metallo-hydrolase [Pontiellaceae bacterium]|nr:MBL fold metallo-hydrolase [Pontiellaceae bacterium]